DANIVLIGALFVIGDGLVRTGVARRLGDWLTLQAGSSEARLIVLLMIVVCGLGSIMSSTAVTALFIPVALRIAQRTHVSPRRLLMPLSMAALISGMMTLVGTPPNLIVNGELIKHLERTGQSGAEGFSFFGFTPFGVPILGLAIVYMLIVRRWLPASTGDSPRPAPARPTMAEWIGLYHLAERELRVRILPGSRLANRTLGELRLRDATEASVVAIERGHELLQPTSRETLRLGDVLLIDFPTPEADADAMRHEYGLEKLPLRGAYFTDHSQEIGMAEMLLPADSKLIGKSVADADLRS